MFESIVAILAALMLLTDVLRRGSTESRITSVLIPLQGVIGLIALVVGVLNFFNIIGLALIAGGLILAAETLSGIPVFGDGLKRAGQAIKGIGGLVGAILLVLAVYRLLLI